ncbi:hypothetical protein [Bernardetia sp.]|uniref:hypothetical protein n=1 Tax=Bernardetia sp. TaxID=1937974 RepID=UPI0025BE00B1|nr:hypothetical protein [Bernardetia sp.]
MNITFRNTYVLAILAILSLSLTSCFDIKEEVTIKKDGSGSFIQTFDLGSNPMVQMALNMQSDSAKNANKPTNKMDSTMESTKERLSQIKGISNVKTASSEEDLKFSIMYDFEDVDALNRAINASKEEKEGEVKVMKKLYSFKKGEFTKANSFAMGNSDLDLSELMGGKKDGDSEQTEEEKAQAKQMMQMFFGNANYTYIVHVPNKVKSYSNKKNTTVSEDGKTLTMNIPLLELMNNDKKIDVGNSVKFK